MFAILGHLFFSLDSQFPLLCFSFLSDQYFQAISNVFSLCYPQPLLHLIIVYHCSFSVLFLTELIFCNLLQVEGCDTVQNSFSPKTKKKEKINGAMTSVSFDLLKINSVPSLCLSSYNPNRIYHTYMTLPKELGSWFRQRDWIQRISPKPCFSAL